MDLPSKIGRYEVVRLLGQGGMGRVVLAKDTVLGRRVAVKTLRDDLGLPPELKASLTERMRNEAKAAAALSHPNMVTLFDMGEDEALGLYLVFEYVEGPTLRERLTDGPLAPLEVAKLARELGAALTHAHEAAVIHRDVKPENVILAKTGAKLADFGIARVPDSTLTQGGVMMGTPAYSAPEALAKGDFSAASDQFSLAATLYEALGGRRAFAGEDALEIATKVATLDPEPLSEGEPELGRRLVMGRAFGVLSRALAKDKTRRYLTCQAFGDALAASIDVRQSGAYATLPPPSHGSSIVPRATRRWQNLVAAGGLLVIATLVILGRRGEEQGASLSRTQNELERALASASASSRAPPPKPKLAPPRPTATAASAPTDAGAADAPPGPTLLAPQPL